MAKRPLIHLVNRTTEPLDSMVDGRPIVLTPGYVRQEDGAIVGAGPGGTVAVNVMEDLEAELCKRQHPLLGSEDPEGVNDNDWLCGVEAWGDDIGHLEQSDAEERFDRSLMSDEAGQAKVIRKAPRGRGRRKRGRRHIDVKLKNPAGIRADYAD